MNGREIVLVLICLVCSRTAEGRAFDPRIIGGVPAILGEFKSQVAITGDGVGILDSKVCGGILISPVQVLTAAQCTSKRGQSPKCDQLFVIGDDLSVSHIVPSPERQTRKAVKCLVHPEYNIMNYPINDVALVSVDKAFDVTETFEPWTIGRGDYRPVDGELCRIAGWGVTDNKDPKPHPSFDLMAVNISVIPMETCNATYQNLLTPDVFCAGETGADTGICYADTGSALICNGTIKGIASIRFGCEKTHPGVFTSVYNYLHWIEDNFTSSGESNHAILILIGCCLLLVAIRPNDIQFR